MSVLTQAPLPRLRDLIATIFKHKVSDRAIVNPWVTTDDQCYWFSRSTWSLIVIAQWRQQLLCKQDIVIWIPALFCSEVLQPLRGKGVKFVFYPLNDDMHPTYSRFDELSKNTKPDIFVLIHYFGAPACTENAVAFCKYHGAWLVEDAAHVLKPVSGVGKVGDFVLYSPHKHLAIPDGALFVVRGKGPAALGSLLNGMPQLDRITLDYNKSAKFFNKENFLWVTKRILQRLGLRSISLSPPLTFYNSPKTVIVDPVGMSILAKRLLSRAVHNLPQIAAKRQECANLWHGIMEWSISQNNFNILQNPATPYLFILRVNDICAAESLFRKLQSAGLPVTTWPDLPTEISSNINENTNAWALRHTRIYLPVHQSMDEKKILKCGKKLQALLTKKWKLKRITHKEEWDSYWKKCGRKTMPQPWEYGEAKEVAQAWRAQRYVIFNEYDEPTAIVQVLVKSIPILGGVARINRGPLLLVDKPDCELKNKLGAIRVLMREARKNRWWLVQIAPELAPSTVAEKGLKALGFKKQQDPPEASALLDLSPNENELMMQLKGKWRNCLRKGEKLGVCVKLTEANTHFHVVVDYYKKLKSQNNFTGISEKMLRAMMLNQSDVWRFNIFVAMVGSNTFSEDYPLGVLVTLQYHDTSVYLIGATNEKGRQMQANSVLLWHALIYAKKCGCKWFDVGGLAKSTPKGIASFKKGLNAKPYQLIGEWRKWF